MINLLVLFENRMILLHNTWAIASVYFSMVISSYYTISIETQYFKLKSRGMPLAVLSIPCVCALTGCNSCCAAAVKVGRTLA